MPETGIRELKIRASELVRHVRERKVRYIITHRGRPVAVLGPVEGTPLPRLVLLTPRRGNNWSNLVRRSAKAGGRGRTVQSFSQSPAAERPWAHSLSTP